MFKRHSRPGVILSALVAVAFAALVGCAPKQAPTTVETAPPVSADAAPEPEIEPAVVESVYERLEEGQRHFVTAVDLLASGEEIAGETELVAATRLLDTAATDCTRTPGCEISRFLTAFDELLALQSVMVKQQAYRIQTLEESVDRDVDREPGTSAFVDAMPEIGRTVSLLKGTDLREIIELNGPVSAALDDWLTWMRPMLMGAYENYQFLRDDIAPIYEEAGLPEALLFAMIATESGGKVHAYSRAGAAGLLQFMSRTGRTYGLTVVDGFDLRLDPAAATRANVAYLDEQFGVFNDSLDKALAAYNGGETRMQKLDRRYGGANLWDRRMYYSLPRETREYVPRVLAAAWLFLHPEDYNLEFPDHDTRKTLMTVEHEVAIGELTICLGQEHNPNGWFRTLRNLNPSLGPGDRIEAGTEIVVPEVLVPIYRDRCLGGEIVEVARKLHDANYPEGSEMVPYIVRRGDTLGKIASRYRCVSIGELADINGIRPPRFVIRVGQELKIPQCG